MTTPRTKKKKLKEDRVSVADARLRAPSARKDGDGAAPSASSKKKQNKTGEAAFVGASVRAFFDEAATCPNPPPRASGGSSVA